MYGELPRTPLATVPGTTYAYSNFGAALLGQLLADRAHEDYSTLLHDRITAPLGLSQTTADFSTANAAQPHDGNGDPTVYWHLQAIAPAGAVRSTLHDMLRFAQAEMTAPAGSTMAQTQQIAATLTDPQIGGPRKMGLGWHTNLGPGLEAVLWHNGETGGFYSFMAVDVARQSAIVMLANSSEPFLDNLGVALLQVAEGQHPALELPPLVDVDDATLASYEGRYDFGGGFVLDIAHEPGRLYVTPTGQPKFRLYPESSTLFDLHAVPASLEFTANAVTLHQGGDHVGTKLPR
jgi:CubicO group peptidase (beta-lactamase class C family)